MPPKGRIVVDELYCKGCEMCVRACPQDVIILAPERITAKGYHPATLKSEGCTHLVVSTACGSLREEIAPGQLVILDQFIDR